MKIRLASLLAVLALVVMAIPASAAPANQVVLFTGTATVCADGGDSDDCPSGQSGLGLPIGANRNGTYEFNNSDIAGTGTSCVVLPSGVPCSISVEGDLAPMAGLVGAACGASEGSDGDGNAAGFDVENVGWTASAGGTLPITSGTYDDGAGTSGDLRGVVQAQGGSDCVGAEGADRFNVVGAVAAI